MDLGLRDRVFLVTGGSRGLGFAAARELVAEGAHVVISSRNAKSLEAAAQRLVAGKASADRVAWIASDNADPESAARLITTAKERFGRLDGALVSVGGTPAGTGLGTSDEVWRAGFEDVFLGAVRLARDFVRLAATDANVDVDADADADAVKGTGASLVFILAASVRVPIANLPVSNAVFPALAGAVKMLAREVGPSGIRLNGVLPVRIATDRVREFDALSGDPDEVRVAQSQLIPLRRYGEPEEFGRVAAFLLSPAASFITGAMVPVDGGAIPSI
ncbi:MAG TPA: SDR family oxidoreductase [Frankiaceae bacterium]|jgi:3-oxoacyl-[acyl-carrier protein] reductase|nr:SDR family oxidoreductase [Frankiaceae bacterium]